ncbi:PREDICTED: uncharacterized protein LOC106805482 [Priapulus caudatus]|uniref:Uncharacterized protein LOC106805482 n=1 Tax=Priapulus caudatus TaxID=37621 RepID=A0ABM1DRJ9_PRICU|nr:PREDICTED: uncharacterized protein LOC106805482 [Priapulus caudatus]
MCVISYVMGRTLMPRTSLLTVKRIFLYLVPFISACKTSGRTSESSDIRTGMQRYQPSSRLAIKFPPSPETEQTAPHIKPMGEAELVKEFTIAQSVDRVPAFVSSSLAPCSSRIIYGAPPVAALSHLRILSEAASTLSSTTVCPADNTKQDESLMQNINVESDVHCDGVARLDQSKSSSEAGSMRETLTPEPTTSRHKAKLECRPGVSSLAALCHGAMQIRGCDEASALPTTTHAQQSARGQQQLAASANEPVEQICYLFNDRRASSSDRAAADNDDDESTLVLGMADVMPFNVVAIEEEVAAADYDTGDAAAADYEMVAPLDVIDVAEGNVSRTDHTYMTPSTPHPPLPAREDGENDGREETSRRDEMRFGDTIEEEEMRSESDATKSRSGHCATAGLTAGVEKKTVGDKKKMKLSREEKIAKPNYFVAIQVSSKEVHDAVKQVQDKLREHDAKLAAACIHPATLHLTMAVMNLAEDDLKRAHTAMESCSSELVSDQSIFPLLLDFHGIGHFGNSVIFAHVKDGDGLTRLSLVAGKVREHLERHGLRTEKKPFAAHLTILKMSKARHLQRSKVDPSYYKEYEEMAFGNQQVESLQLLSMNKPKDTNGYYYCSKEVNLTAPDAEMAVADSDELGN